jgi:hypothetical protein
MEMSENIADLAAALAKAQADLEGAAKKSNNPAFRSKYADLGAVWDAWQEVGPKNGLSVVQFPTDMADPKMVGMTTMLLHTSGQWMRGLFSLPAGKQDAHGYGSAVTYLRRFSLSAVVGVCPVDDDGNAAAKTPAKAVADAPSATITAGQLATLRAALDELPAGWAEKVCAGYGIEALPDLPADAFPAASKKLLEHVAKHQAAQRKAA